MSASAGVASNVIQISSAATVANPNRIKVELQGIRVRLRVVRSAPSTPERDEEHRRDGDTARLSPDDLKAIAEVFEILLRWDARLSKATALQRQTPELDASEPAARQVSPLK